LTGKNKKSQAPLGKDKGKQATLFKYLLHACLGLSALIGATAQASLSSLAPLTNQAIAKIAERYGKSAEQQMLAWQKLIANAGNKSEAENVGLVNEFFNRVRFVSDQENWGEKDFWATPLEMLATNGGDCEDYSIAKYFTLKTMGIPVERLRITHVMTREQNRSHIVLAYYPIAEHSSTRAEPLVLDNLNPIITPLSQRSDLLPVYSFNSLGLWIQKEQGQIKTASPHHIKPWSTLIAKMQQQGLYL